MERCTHCKKSYGDGHGSEAFSFGGCVLSISRALFGVRALGLFGLTYINIGGTGFMDLREILSSGKNTPNL